MDTADERELNEKEKEELSEISGYIDQLLNKAEKIQSQQDSQAGTVYSQMGGFLAQRGINYGGTLFSANIQLSQIVCCFISLRVLWIQRKHPNEPTQFLPIEGIMTLYGYTKKTIKAATLLSLSLDGTAFLAPHCPIYSLSNWNISSV
eukprot:TRINITY_DN138153_c0_g1_i1.p2 TRINITY_DN138153_c0_g1~~TRINITY_DN138153_c0_g1_i1.p2  ORF type:complete len:159 (-),score=4.61 TRINITY_DN138153_c0_g1_i1:512-955(-)